ncbi:MAG: flavodoxin FldB [Cellvibrionaceae bacterium]|nr:flavodoxin FldB [Cellvibrionaceae bacterium]
MNDPSATIGLFYGSSTCYTEMSAYKIQQYFGEDRLHLYNVADTSLQLCDHYQHLIFGIPTWDYGELQEDWEACWDAIDAIDFTGKAVALYGLGDQIGYPEWFLDAMGYLHNKVFLRGATMVGYWPNHGYQFTASQALTADQSHFLGLALDDENQYEQTEQRIAQWCEQIEQAFFN